jgi:hypothetical protein
MKLLAGIYGDFIGICRDLRRRDYGIGAGFEIVGMLDFGQS